MNDNLNDKSLPPQAFTRELFSQAYEWLRSQSAQVQELAKNPDDIVGLYMQARRHRQHNKAHFTNQETAVSTKNFRSELKNLAQDLKSFDDNSFVSKVTDPILKAEPLLKAEHVIKNEKPIESPKTQTYAHSTTAHENVTTDFGVIDSLDDRSFQMISEVKKRFNLSSDTETLRLMLVLGYERVLENFPNQ